MEFTVYILVQIVRSDDVVSDVSKTTKFNTKTKTKEGKTKTKTRNNKTKTDQDQDQDQDQDKSRPRPWQIRPISKPR